AFAVHRRRPLLRRHFITAICPDALGVRRDRVERHAELGGREFGAAARRELDRDGLLDHVDALRHRAAGRPALATATRRDVERLADLWEPTLHLLVGLELVDEAAL